MSYSNIFCEKGRKDKGYNVTQKQKEDDPYSFISPSSFYASFNKGDFSSRKATKSFQSVRLSITDLLQRVEKQTENSTKLFPLLDKDKYQRKKIVPSKSKDSLEDINSYYDTYYDRMHRTCNTDPFADMDVFARSFDEHDTDTDFLVEEPQQNTESRNQMGNNELGKQQMIVTKGLSLPPRELLTECSFSRRESGDCSIMFGVRIEYMTLSNKLKVNVERFGNLPSENGKKEFDVLVAKVSMFPGNVQKQKIKVSNGEVTSLDKPSAYFRGISSPDLIQREIGVGIYLRKGFFRRPMLIYEWKVSMENLDLIEPVTVWRKMDCHM